MTTLNEYLESIGAEAFTPSQSREGCIIVINVPNSKRFRLSKDLAQALGNPTGIEMYFAKDKLIITADYGKGFKFSSGGIIYNSKIAKKIMDLSGAEFPEGKSVRLGSYEMKQMEDGIPYAEVRFD